MSEVVTGGMAAVAVGACAAAAGLALVAGYAAYRGLLWLSDQAKGEMERLEKELAAPVSHATTRQARAHFERQFALFKDEAARTPVLRDYADAVARILALRNSPLGLFVQKKEWNKILQPAVAKRSFAEALGLAAKRFTQANAAYLSRSIVEVAKEVGFKGERSDRIVNGRRTLVMEDQEGRALVAEVIESDEGPQLNLDLAGFGDGSCHGVIDRVLSGLTERGIRIDGLHRRSHFSREGVLPSTMEYTREKTKASGQTYPDQERRKAEAHRRRQLHGAERLKIRQ